MPAFAQPVHLTESSAPVPRVPQSPPVPVRTGLDEFFDRLDSDLERRHQMAWRKDYQNWLGTLLAYQGYVIMPRGNGIGFELVQFQPTDPIYPLNKLRYFVDDVINQWVQSKPYIDILAIAKADDERMRATRSARAVNEHYTRLQLTETFLQELAKGAAICGNYHVCQYFDPLAPGPKVKRPVLGQQPTPGGQLWSCTDCGQAGLGEATQCPQCGSDQLVVRQRPGGTPITSVTGYQEVNSGDLVLQLAPAWQLRYDRADVADKSPWLRRARDIGIETLRALFPDKNIQASAARDDLDHPDRLMRQATAAVIRGGVYGAGEDDSHYVEFIETWYEPEMYRECILPADETLQDGRVLPAGTPLVTAYPTGIYRAKHRGGQGALLMRAESHREHWSHQRLIIVPGRGVGDNIKDALEYYRQSNLLNSLRFTALRKAASPTLVINRGMIRDSQLVTTPGKVIGVEATDIREGQTLAHAFAAVPAMPVTPDLAAYEQSLQGGMQLAVKSLTLSAGLPFVNNKTATGAQIGEQKAQQARSAELALLADFYKDISAKRLKLAQQYLDDERVLHITGRNGQMESIAFRAADIATDFVLWVRGTSYMPSSPLTRQANLEGALNVIGILVQLKLWNPQTQRLVQETYDMELNQQDEGNYADWTRQTINRLKAALPQVSQQMQMFMASGQTWTQPDPMTGQPMPVDPMQLAGMALGQVIEVDPYEVGQEDKIMLLREWLTGDEGQELLTVPGGKIFRAGIHNIIDRLDDAVKRVRERVMQTQMAGMPPMAGAMAGADEQGGLPPMQKKGEAVREQARQNEPQQIPNNPHASPGHPQLPGQGGAQNMRAMTQGVR